MQDDLFVPRVREDIQYRELEDGGVIYDTAAERIHTLNATAAYIWNCCDGLHNLLEIASELQRNLAVIPGNALQDVRQIVSQFDQEGLLRSQ
jgi:Coenzyme PQQ synthesis protein D (PqqD)